ncbi:MAG: parvulin peptidyl-prolyl isomerase [Calditrichaeota bacterium]|nr:MAG: parvulin peptidyl-prolyl isomerase [Calditrichota bacterium]
MNSLKILILTLTLIFSAKTLFAQEVIDKVIAVVDDEIILASEIEQFVQNMLYQSNSLDKSESELEEIRNDVLQRLISQKVILAKAIDDTVEVDAAQVQQAVEEQIDRMMGYFGTEDKLIEQLGYSLRAIRRKYRQEITKNLKVEKLQRERFAKLTVSRNEVERFYAAEKDSLPQVDESVRLSHILLDALAGGGARELALQKIIAIQDSLKKGGNFADLAESFSDDPGSSQNGGELGWVERGVFVKEFEKVAFGLEQNEISDLVETQFGFHIIQLLERRGEKINTRHILSGFRTSSNDEKAVLDTLKSFKDRIENGSTTFEDLAQKYSLDKETAFKGGNLGWFEIGKLTNGAFREQITKLKENEISEPFKSEFGFHLLRLEERKPPRDLSLDEDWEQLQGFALNFKKEKEYQKWVESLKENVFIEIRQNNE